MRKKIQKKKIPDLDEQEFLDTIDKISKSLVYKFKFGYHEIEDMKQQISIFAIEGLQKYDSSRPLENFLWTHVRNRLFNFKRDSYQRPDKPCDTCEYFDKSYKNNCSDCTAFEEKRDCPLYSKWYSRNNIKKNLMYLKGIEEMQEFFSFSKSGDLSLEQQEIILLLDEKLYGENRKVYLKLKQGSKVRKAELNKLQAFIKEIL